MSKNILLLSLLPADRIVVPKSSLRLIEHHALYLGQNQRGVHFIAENKIGIGVRLVTADIFFKDVIEITRIEKFYGTNHQRKYAVQKALRKIGQPYHLIDYNCQHFANEIQYSQPHSNQVENFAEGLTVVAGAAVVISLLNLFTNKNLNQMGKVIQDQFITFHDTIRLDFNDNKEVIKKRDMLIEEIRSAIKKMCEEKGIKLIRFIPFNQGSYAMGTGIKPIYDEDDYDIDCGLLFEIDKGNYTPVEVKKWVYDALNIQFRTVEWKKACIRVQYVEAGLPNFHVDFACYADENSDGKTYLAKGTPTSTTDNKKWEASEPKKLRDLINNKYSNDEECNQFKREIRYMKRWKDYQFDSGNGQATGIAFTALAYDGFRPYIKDPFTWEKDINDLKATKDFVNFILNRFEWNGRIKVQLPVPPQNDLFTKMTDQHCKNLKKKLEDLRDALEAAEDEADPHEACKILRKQFGDDFPVPAKVTTGQNRKLAVAGTSESA